MKYSISARFARSSVALSTLILSASTAYSASFSVRIPRIPPIAGKQCDDFAYAEGQRFREYAGPGISVTDARCYKTAASGQIPSWNVAITYEAESKIEQVSTADENSLDNPGIATRAACDLALKEESARYTRLTKLPIFSAYCRMPTYQDDPWEVVVLGFGKAAIRPYTSSVTIFGDIVGHSHGSFATMLKQGFAKVGAELGQASITNRLAYSTLAIGFYSKERILLAGNRIATFTTKELCLPEVDAASKALSEAGVTSFGVYCRSVYSNEIELSTVRDRNTRIVFSDSDKRYVSNELCMQDKAAVIAHYRNNLHRDIKAGFCSSPRSGDTPKETQYRVVMIEKR